MKKLHTSGEWVLGYLDDKNFVVTKIDKYEKDGETKEKMRDAKYFSDLAGAWHRLATLIAGAECKDVASYVETYVRESSKLRTLGI